MEVDAKSKAKISIHPVEGEVGLDEEVPLSLQGSIELSLEVEPTPKIEEM